MAKSDGTAAAAAVAAAAAAAAAALLLLLLLLLLRPTKSWGCSSRTAPWSQAGRLQQWQRHWSF
jgi:hypothetical protein